MPDNRIPQFPVGVLTPISIFPIVTNGETAQIPFNHILAGAINYDVHLTAGTYNPSNATTTLALNNNTTIDIAGYFELGYIPEDILNKQNSMLVDGSGIKYPTVDAVNGTMNQLAKTILNTGFIDSSDSFFMSRIDDFTLALSASNKGIIFKNILDTPPFAPSSAILNIPDMVVPLSGISFTGDGIYIRFIGYNSDGNIVYSATSFQTSYDTAQLGVLILKVSGGTVSFEDATRGIINIPTIAGYSNFERTSLGLQSNITVRPNPNSMTVNNTNGSLKGMSVNYHGINNDDKPFASHTATTFTHLSYANALTPTPVPFVSAVTTDKYWNGSALVNLTASTSATVQRWLVTINGTIALQYGEREYVDLTTARDNIATATFLDVIPKDTYAEIGRMAAISGTTDLSDTTQAVFIVTAGGNGNITNVSFWGEITGSLSAQTDLFETFQVPVDNSFINLGTGTTATTINLSTNRNYNLTITGNTGLNFISGPDGTENNLVINMPLPVNPTITTSGNVFWHGGITTPLVNIDGGRDISFSGIVAGTGLINAIAIQQDNKYLLGGQFNQVNGVSNINNITRLNLDGSSDNAFNFYIGSGYNSSINTLAQQPDGKILVGGSFSQYYNVLTNCISRLNSDGTPDNTFNIGTGFNNTVEVIVVQTGDSKILLGGSFTQYSGITSNRIIRLFPDGTIDTSFSAGTGFNGAINMIEFQSDGKLLVGGFYSRYQGTIIANNIIRLNPDGTYDSSFSGGVNNGVVTIKQQSDNKILLGGQFTTANPIVAGGLLKMNYDETPDQPFQSTIGAGFSRVDGGSVTTWASVQQPDGKLVVLGDFTRFNNQPIINVARLNPDGTLDSTFSVSGTGFTTTFRSALAVQTDSKVLVGSQSIQFSGIPTGTLIRLTSGGTFDGSFQSNIGTGATGQINVITIPPDNKILVGGTGFNRLGSNTIGNFIKLNSDGTIDNTFNVGTGFNNSVYAILIQPDNKVLVAGQFTQYSGNILSTSIIRLNPDATRDISFSGIATTGFSGAQILALALQPDGKIVVGGSFGALSGVATNNIVRLNSDGNRDNTFVIGAGFNSSILQNGLTVQLDGKIVCGGNFSTYNGVAKNYFARLNSDGSLDTTFNTGAGFNFGLVQVNTVQASGETKLFVTGNFSLSNGVPQGRITRLNSDGSYDPTFNVGAGFNNFVRAIHIQSPHNKILVGGEFLTLNGVSKPYIVRFNDNGSIDTSFIITTNNGITSGINRIVQQFDSKIVIVGQYTNRITRLTASTDSNVYLKIKQEGTNIIIK